MPNAVTFTDLSGPFLDMVRKAVIKGMDQAGLEGSLVAYSLTPVLTGFAQNSVHHVVQDEGGAYLAGDYYDHNGNVTPNYPATGMVTLYVGSNTVMKDGKGYYLGLELGTSAKGSGMLAKGMDAVEAVVLDDVRAALVQP